MSKTLREMLLEALERERQKTPEELQEDLKDSYKGISKEDAVRVQQGLLAVMDAGTREEQRQREQEYKSLHAELRKKYKRKSGTH